MKKIITAVLAAVLLTAMTGASASQAGTAADPLVTKSYLDNTYVPAVLTRINQILTGRLGGAQSAPGPDAGQLTGYARTSGNQTFNLPPAGQITVGQGGSLIVTSGAVAVTVTSGEVIDIATGKTVPTGTVLTARKRYFSTENTQAVYSASSWAAVMVDGPYLFNGDPEAQAYTDVDASDWFASASLYAWQKQLFRDWQEPLFRPDGTVTRAEIIYAIWTAAGAPNSDYPVGYTDITESWYLPAVCWATEKGIVQGTGDNKLSPDGQVDRATIVTMLFRATAVTGVSAEGRADLTAFTDAAAIPDWAAESVSWAVANGIVLGVGDGTFSPQTYTSRSQIAALLMRMF